MSILLGFVLFFLVLNLIFTIQVSRFLVSFAARMDKRINEMQEEPPLNVSRNTRNLESEDEGLVDVEGTYNYDPRYTNPISSE